MDNKQKFPAKTEPAEFDGGLNFSKKIIFRIFYLSVIIAALGVSGFLFYQEYKRSKVFGEEFDFSRPAPPDFKDYSNDYWGFKFKYPGSWWPVVGSFKDGEYYFASAPINFIQELEEGQAMLEVRTYNNWKGLSFEEWLEDQQKNYLPQGLVKNQKPFGLKGYEAISYSVELNKPINTAKDWEVAAVSKNNNIKYLFILETGGPVGRDRFLPVFKNILDTVEFYPGFGQN